MLSNTELALADLDDTYERAIHRVQKKAKGGDKRRQSGTLAALENACRTRPEAGDAAFAGPERTKIKRLSVI